MSTPSDENILEEYPNPLIVQKLSDSTYQDSSIYLTNKINKYVIYKVYMNLNPPLYSIKPSTGFIKPKESVTLTVKRFYKPTNTKTNTRDKCLIVYNPVDKVITSKEEAKEMFKNKLVNEEDKKEIMVYFEVDNEIKGNSESAAPIMSFEEINQSECRNETSVEHCEEKNKQFKNEIRRIESNISELEKQLENLMKNKELKMLKEKAIKPINSNQKEKKREFSKTFVLFLALVCFAFGGYLGTFKTRFAKVPA